MITLKDWSIGNTQNGFTPPEGVESFIQGNVYGHPKFNDGDSIATSAIQDVMAMDNYKIVKTRNNEYILYEADVDPKAEEQFPNYYSRLSMAHMGCGV